MWAEVGCASGGLITNLHNAYKHCFLYYCTLLLTSSSNPVTRPRVHRSFRHTVTFLYSVLLDIVFVMCLVLLPTPLAQHSHSYGVDSEISELHCHLHTVFCIGHNFETIISGEMLGTPTQSQAFVIYVDFAQKTRLNSYHSVWQQASLQKLGPLKLLIGCCTDFNVDSGSCSGSNLKFWLQLQPKMQTPAGVHSGSVMISARQRWSDSGFLLSDPILFLKNDISIRSESCFGGNHTIRIRKLSKSVLWCTIYIFVLCLFCLVRQNNCWSYFAFSWTWLVKRRMLRKLDTGCTL